MSANIAGTHWAATVIDSAYTAYLPSYVSSDSILALYIAGNDYDPLFNVHSQRGINLVIVNYNNKPGVFKIAYANVDTVNSLLFFDGPNIVDFYDSGVIIITKVSANNIQGNFSGSLNAGLGQITTITNGQFNVYLK